MFHRQQQQQIKSGRNNSLNRITSNKISPMVMSLMCAADSSKCALRPLSSAIPDVNTLINQCPNGSASTQKNQTTNPPSTAPQLLPEPPTITITQIKKVKRSGW